MKLGKQGNIVAGSSCVSTLDGDIHFGGCKFLFSQFSYSVIQNSVIILYNILF